MSSSNGAPTAPVSRRTRILWIGIIAATALVVAAVVTIGIASAGNLAAPGSTPSSTESAYPDGSAGPTDPSASATAPPSGSATPAPDEPPAGSPPIVVEDPLPIDATAQPEAGVTVSVGTFEAVDGIARLPGDVGGPAIRFAVSITNGTDKKISLASALVNVYYGAEQLPASELQEPGGVPLPVDVAAGATANATLVFTIPEDERDDVLITIDYRIGDPVIAFQGAIPS